MKKRKLAKRTAYSIIAGATLASAAFLPGCNRPVHVYGPPPTPETTLESTTEAQETTSAVTEETFETTENIPVAVYGPPEDFTGETVTFNPDENEPVDVYGPPAFIDEPENEETLDTDENIIAGVYGPPPAN